MASDYPGALDSFDTRTTGQIIAASHMNDVQNAIVAVETELGTQPRHTDTTAPTVNDDSGDGYSVGTLWTDTTNDRVYIAIDVSSGAAVWQEITSKAGSWTPTVTQSGSVAVTVNRAIYHVMGRLVSTQVVLSVTGAGTGANAVAIGGQPSILQSPTGGIIGTGMIYDVSVGFNVGAVYVQGATDWRIFCHNEANAAGITPNFALASDDIIYLNIVYYIA